MVWIWCLFIKVYKKYIFNREGNFDRAGECFRRSLQFDGENIICLLNYGAFLIDRHVYDEAEDVLLHILDIDDGNVECYLLLCVLYDKYYYYNKYRFKTQSYFKTYFEHTLEAFDNEYSLHYRTGQLLYGLTMYKLSEEAFIRAGYELINSENSAVIADYNLNYSLVYI